MGERGDATHWKTHKAVIGEPCLRRYCHKIENNYNGFQVIDLKNLGPPEPRFDAIFKVQFPKKHFWLFLF
jgi:hypothetical protein